MKYYMSMHSFIFVFYKTNKKNVWKKRWFLSNLSVSTTIKSNFSIGFFAVYRKKVKLTFFSIFGKEDNIDTDNDKLAEIYFNMVYPHSVIVSVACLLLPSWKSSHSPIVPLVRGIQFVSKALLASYWDHSAGRRCSSKIKPASPRGPSEENTFLRQTLKPNSNAKL